MRKGFTLVELLAVIVILAIILAVAVPGISNIIGNSRLNSFNLSSKMLKEAAGTYISANNITVSNGTTTEILYSDIKNAGYISKIVDPISNNECNHSRIYVTNTGGTYTYKEALVCDNYMDIDAYNLITNNDFSNGTTGWTTSHATFLLSNNILNITGDGNNTSFEANQVTNIASVTGQKIFAKAKMRTLFPGTTNVQLYPRIIGSTGGASVYVADIQNPIQDQWYSISGVITIPADHTGNVKVLLRCYISTTASDTNGKTFQVDGTYGVYAFNLTTIYGAGNEPTATQIDNIMSNMGK